jgi:protein SHQ1
MAKKLELEGILMRNLFELWWRFNCPVELIHLASKFDDERYANDLFSATKIEIDQIIAQEHPFTQYLSEGPEEDIAKRLEKLDLNSSSEVLTKEEIEECLKLRNREYLIDSSSPNIPLQCVEILWAYLYDFRVSNFEHSWESTWSIAKLASTISSFTDWRKYKLKDVLISVYRRSLIFPLYRNFSLSQKITEDLCEVLKIGRKAVLKWFIQLKKLNERRDSGYLINRVFINDFIVWVQQTPEQVFSKGLEELQKIEITKEELDLGIPQIEEIGSQCEWEHE